MAGCRLLNSLVVYVNVHEAFLCPASILDASYAAARGCWFQGPQAVCTTTLLQAVRNPRCHSMPVQLRDAGLGASSCDYPQDDCHETGRPCVLVLNYNTRIRPCTSLQRTSVHVQSVYCSHVLMPCMPAGKVAMVNGRLAEERFFNTPDARASKRRAHSQEDAEEALPIARTVKAAPTVKAVPTNASDRWSTHRSWGAWAQAQSQRRGRPLPFDPASSQVHVVLDQSHTLHVISIHDSGVMPLQLARSASPQIHILLCQRYLLRVMSTHGSGMKSSN